MRGVRGATTAAGDDEKSIWRAVQDMVVELLKRNNLKPADIGAMIFTVTDDLTAAFPSTGVRQLVGFDSVPLFDACQPNIDGSLPRCIRVLVLADTDKKQTEIHHVYMGEAVTLRPDISNKD